MARKKYMHKRSYFISISIPFTKRIKNIHIYYLNKIIVSFKQQLLHWHTHTHTQERYASSIFMAHIMMYISSGNGVFIVCTSFYNSHRHNIHIKHLCQRSSLARSEKEKKRENVNFIFFDRIDEISDFFLQLFIIYSRSLVFWIYRRGFYCKLFTYIFPSLAAQFYFWDLLLCSPGQSNRIVNKKGDFYFLEAIKFNLLDGSFFRLSIRLRC